MEKYPVTERQELATRVGHIETACIAVSWALDVLASDSQVQEKAGKRFELISGMGFILELVSRDLKDVYERLNGE